MNLRKTLAISRRFVVLSFMQWLTYRKSFILAIISKIGRMLILLIFFEAVFLHVERIGSWDRNGVLVLVAVYLSIESLIIITFHRNLAYYFPDLLRKGTFDDVLVKPLPVLPHVSFRIIDLMDLISSITVVILWLYILINGIVHPGIQELLLFFTACTLAIIFTFSLSTIIAVISFWSLAPTGLGRLYEQLFRTGRYPSDALGSTQGFLLTYLIPFAIVGTVPASALRGALNASTLVWSAITILGFTVLASILWKKGLKKYSSASS